MKLPVARFYLRKYVDKKGKMRRALYLEKMDRKHVLAIPVTIKTWDWLVSLGVWVRKSPAGEAKN